MGFTVRNEEIDDLARKYQGKNSKNGFFLRAKLSKSMSLTVDTAVSLD